MSGVDIDVLRVLVAAYLVLVAGACWAAWGIVRDWRSENGRDSALFTALMTMDVLIVVAALLTVPLTVNFLLGLPPIQTGGILVIGVLMVMVVAVIVHRLAFDRVKRRRGRIHEAPTIPPAAELEPTEEPTHEDGRRTEGPDQRPASD